RGRRGRLPGQPDTALAQLSRAGQGHHVNPVPQLMYSILFAPKMLLQFAVQDIGQLTDIGAVTRNSDRPAVRLTPFGKFLSLPAARGRRVSPGSRGRPR